MNEPGSSIKEIIEYHVDTGSDFRPLIKDILSNHQLSEPVLIAAILNMIASRELKVKKDGWITINWEQR